MLEFDNVSKSFGGVKAVDQCTFNIPSASITGLIGPNGAGKTTAFNIIAGHQFAQTGRIIFDGEDVTRLPAWRRQSIGLSRTFQLPHEFARLSVLDNLIVAAENRQGENIVNAIFRPRRGRLRSQETRTMAISTLEFLEISSLRDELAGNVSGGQKKLLELGRALMQRPKLILLDEIGAGVNRTLLAKIADKILELNANEGYTFCLIEHDLDYVSRLCDQVNVMVQGRLLTCGTVAEIRNDERVIDVYFGGGKYQDKS